MILTEKEMILSFLGVCVCIAFSVFGGYYIGRTSELCTGDSVYRELIKESKGMVEILTKGPNGVPRLRLHDPVYIIDGRKVTGEEWMDYGRVYRLLLFVALFAFCLVPCCFFMPSCHH